MAIVMWNFMDKEYNDRLAPTFRVWILTETSTRTLSYVYETWYHGNKMWYNESVPRFCMVNRAKI